MRVLTECNLAQIVVDILAGKTIVFPTETSYGLGCDATNQQAVDHIFEIKGRWNEKPLLVVVPTVEAAKKYLAWNELLDTIASRYWPPYIQASGGKPGPVTVVGEANANVGLARGVVSKENTLAVRVTADPLLRSITEKLGRPLVATSANVAAGGDCYSAEAVVEQLQNQTVQPDIILDRGEIPHRPPTTIVSVVNNVFKLIRQGEQQVTP